MNWRTTTVVELCRSMREAGDYSALPILADALEDADFNDANLLNQFRTVAPNRTTAERIVAILYSDETAKAVADMQAFADLVGYTYEKVIEGVRVYAATGDQYEGEAGYNRDDPDYDAAWAAQGAFGSDDPNSWEDDPEKLNEFFTVYELVTGTRVEARHRGSCPFTCPC